MRGLALAFIFFMMVYAAAPAAAGMPWPERVLGSGCAAMFWVCCMDLLFRKGRK